MTTQGYRLRAEGYLGYLKGTCLLGYSDYYAYVPLPGQANVCCWIKWHVGPHWPSIWLHCSAVLAEEEIPDNGLHFSVFDVPYNSLYRPSSATDRAAYNRQDDRAQIRQIYVPELIIRLHYILYSLRKLIPESVLSVFLPAVVKLLIIALLNPGTLNAPSSWQILLLTHDTGCMRHLVATVGEPLLITSRSCDRLWWQD